MKNNIVFIGTSEFAVPILKALEEACFNIVCVITQPDRPAGRHLSPAPSPVKLWARNHGLKVFQSTSPLPPPQAWGGIEGGVELSQVDIAIVASYGKIIPKEILELPRYGILNIHPSLLPKYRGPSPIHAAILNGDEETGVTIIKMDEKMDHGDVIASAKYLIQNTKYSYQELHDKLAQLGAKLLIETLPKYLRGEIKPIEQDHSQATYTKIITKEDAKIDWSKQAGENEAMVRAYEVWPVAWTILDGKRLKIYKAISTPPPQAWGGVGGEVVGTVIAKDNRILVHCGSGMLEIQELQLEGHKKMSAEEFIRGFRGLNGRILNS